MSRVPREQPLALNWLLNTLLAGSVLVAITVLFAWLTSRSRLEGMLSSLAAASRPYGAGNVPTQEGVKGVLSRLPFLAAFLMICAISLALFKEKLGRFLAGLPTEWPEIRNSLRQEFLPGPETCIEFAAILTLCAIGLFVRLWFIGRPIRYDEAATYLNFASKPFYRALSNYSYPNNHLLNTLLARVSMLTLGDSTFALRLPALVAGWLTIPMAWLTARTLFDRWTGILTAGFVAALPTFVEFSVNSRGYSLQWFFILAIMCCSAILLVKPALKTVWLLFVIAGVAGFYAVPTMAIPVSAMAIWILLSELLAKGISSWRKILVKLLAAGYAIVLLSILLYVPPLVASGPQAVFSNRFVARRADSFLSGLGPLAHSTWVRWTDGVPTGVIYLVIGGIALGILFHHRLSCYRVPMTLLLWVWTFCFAWARDILGYPRVWHYLLLAAIMTGSAGISLAIRQFIRQGQLLAVSSILSMGLAGWIGFALIQEHFLFRNNETAGLIDTRQIIGFLDQHVGPGDGLIVCHPAGPIIEYELLRGDPKVHGSLSRAESAGRVIAVVPKPEVDSESYRTDELLARLSAQDSADPSAASALIDLSQYFAPKMLAKFQSVTVYEFDRK